MSKIGEGLKLKGQPAEIPNVSRNDLPEFFKERGFVTGVEVGVYLGKFTKVFAKEGFTMFGIDPWFSYRNFDIISDNRKERQDEIYEMAKKRLAPYPKVKLIRKISMDAIDDFEDGSLDFVYIDGNHKFRYVAEDMCEWWEKLKVGGVLCGHDYIHPKRVDNRWHNLQVKFVVDAFVLAYRIDNWYVLGEQDSPWGDVRDKFRSWMIIKK